MSNTLLTISMITREALRILENDLAFGAGVNREYDDKFAIEGAKIGDTLNIRKPARFVGRTGPTLSIENYTETSVPLVLDTQFGVDCQWNSKDMALSLDDFSERFLKPAVATVANKIDSDGMAQYKNVYNYVGTPGVTPAALLTFLSAKARLAQEATPMDGLLSAVVDPLCEASMVDALKGLFQDSTEIAKQYVNGNIGRTAGFKWSMDQNTQTHTVGALGGTPLVDGASQTGSSLLTKGWTAVAANRLKQGDVITLAGVYAVNPQSRRTTGALRDFVVTADFSSDASGNGTVSIYPPITTSGAFQTVTGSPADGAAILTFGAVSSTGGVATTSNLTYHRDAFTLGCADLPLPNGVDMAARASDPQLGISIRMIRAYDINNDRFPCRLDVLYGWKTIYPELACRVQG